MELTADQKAGVEYFKHLKDTLTCEEEDVSKWERKMIDAAHEAFKEGKMTIAAFGTCVDEILCY